MTQVLRLLVIAALASILVAASSNRAEAASLVIMDSAGSPTASLANAAGGDLVENFSGEFGPTTTLNGTAFGSDTAFSLQAVFNPAAGISLATGAAGFAASLTIDITGYGTYTGSTGVLLVDQTYTSLLGNYGVGLTNSTASAFFGGVFRDATPNFLVTAATATTFSSFIEYSNVAVSGSLPFTISLTSTVPEPSTLIGAAQAVLLLGLASRLRRRKA